MSKLVIRRVGLYIIKGINIGIIYSNLLIAEIIS